LVVLVLLAGALALLPGLVAPRQLPQLDQGARQIAQALRQARAEAMTAGRNRRVVLDLGARELIDARGRVSHLPERLALSLLTAGVEREGELRGGIRFFADGGSTGGRMRLEDGPRALEVTVDWLTGRVGIDAP
jgi:general secretion pathway protein H